MLPPLHEEAAVPAEREAHLEERVRVQIVPPPPAAQHAPVEPLGAVRAELNRDRRVNEVVEDLAAVHGRVRLRLASPLLRSRHGREDTTLPRRASRSGAVFASCGGGRVIVAGPELKRLAAK